MHILALDLEVAIGALTYLAVDVVAPPPQLLFSNPGLYDASLNHAGGVVLMKFMLHVGVPALHWLRAGRSSDGAKAETLHAIAFHMNRATTHKINCVLISLLALWSTTATHPNVAEMVKATTSGSFTGNPGSLMYMDRLQESLNNVQDQRDGKFAAFERGLHYTADLQAMMHADQAWQTATKGDSPLHDPVTQSLLNGAAAVRNELRAKLGTDLTVKNEFNPFWHTGNPVKLASGSERDYRPWNDIWTVAEGHRAGVGLANAMSWDAYVHHVIRDMMFPRPA